MLQSASRIKDVTIIFDITESSLRPYLHATAPLGLEMMGLTEAPLSYDIGTQVSMKSDSDNSRSF